MAFYTSCEHNILVQCVKSEGLISPPLRQEQGGASKIVTAKMTFCSKQPLFQPAKASNSAFGLVENFTSNGFYNTLAQTLVLILHFHVIWAIKTFQSSECAAKTEKKKMFPEFLTSPYFLFPISGSCHLTMGPTQNDKYLKDS